MEDILIITNKLDFHTDYIIQKMNDIGKTNIIRFNTEDFISNVDYSYNGNEFELLIKDSNKKITSSKYFNVWYRRPKKIEIEHKDAEIESFISIQVKSFINGFYKISQANSFWVNNPDINYLSKNKLYQLFIAKKTGFNTPKTIISNNRKEIEDFLKKQSGIIKSLENAEIMRKGFHFSIPTREFLLKNCKDVDFKICPTYIQEKIQKKFDIKTVIFGDSHFSFKIHSQELEESKIDFRKADPTKLKYEYFVFNDKISNCINEYMKFCNLNFAVMDFVIDEYDKIYFLECNTNGQWLWLETATDIDLSTSFIKYISKRHKITLHNNV